MGGKRSAITNRVREHRKAQGLSQQALADLIGATRQTVLMVEAERYGPSLELAFRLSRALDVPIETLFHFTEAGD